MCWVSIVGIIGSIASVIGAVISWKQSKEAKKAKDATEAAKEAVEAAKDKFFKNIQYEDFTSFKKECDSTIVFLTRASKALKLNGKSERYVEDELEKFINKLNEAISISKGDTRKTLEGHYRELFTLKKNVNWDDRDWILVVLEEVRKLSRTIKDVQTANKTEV